jgi:hypothetical protein
MQLDCKPIALCLFQDISLFPISPCHAIVLATSKSLVVTFPSFFIHNSRSCDGYISNLIHSYRSLDVLSTGSAIPETTTDAKLLAPCYVLARETCMKTINQRSAVVSDSAPSGNHTVEMGKSHS